MAREHSTQSEALAKLRQRINIVLAAGAVALCAAVVAGLAWTHPTRLGTALSYTESGVLKYSAPTGASSIYGSRGLTTGKPMYLDAVHRVTVSYDFSAISSAPLVIDGTEHLVATVTDALGARRILQLQPVARFARPAFVATGTLDLSRLSAAVASLSRSAGIDGPGTLTVAVSPSVTARGTLGGHPVASRFDKPVDFTYIPGSSTAPAELAPTASAQDGGATGAPAAAALGVSTTIATAITAERPATMFFNWSVSKVRVASLVVLGVSLLIGLLFGLRLLADACSEDESRRIAVRYGWSLVEVDNFPTAPSLVVVEVSSFEGLLQVSKRLECPILHRRRNDDVYAVVDTGTLYRYATSTPARPTGGTRNGSAPRREGDPSEFAPAIDR